MKLMKTIDEYIKGFEPPVQEKLLEIHQIIKEVAPDCDEVINYGIPTFKLKGKNLVHYGGFKNHIGFYPAPSGIQVFAKELSAYKGAKGSVQFPLSEPLPKALIQRIVKFRIAENEKK